MRVYWISNKDHCRLLLCKARQSRLSLTFCCRLQHRNHLLTDRVVFIYVFLSYTLISLRLTVFPLPGSIQYARAFVKPSRRWLYPYIMLLRYLSCVWVNRHPCLLHKALRAYRNSESKRAPRRFNADKCRCDVLPWSAVGRRVLCGCHVLLHYYA